MNDTVRRTGWQYAALALILLVAAGLRLYGLEWDSGYLFHPDERKIVLVASGLARPSSLAEFLSSESPLNPKFFAYGSFPIYLLKALGKLAPSTTFDVPWRQDTFVALGLLGRVLSAAFDLGTIVMIFCLGRRLYGAIVGLVAAAGVAVTVLHIQLSHFYAVDTLLTLLVVVTIYFSVRYAASGRRSDAIGMTIGLGLALATKITAAPLAVPIALAVVKARGMAEGTLTAGRSVMPAAAPRWRRLRWLPAAWVETARGWLAEIWSVRRTLVGIAGGALVVFIVTQPYMILDPIRYFGEVGTEGLVARGWLDYPYTRQYAGTLPFIYQIVQSTVWGMGLALGIAAWGGAALFAWQWLRRRDWRDGFVLSWALVYFATIGPQHAKYLRYLLPLLPFLYLMAAAGIRSLTVAAQTKASTRWVRVPLYAGVVVVGLASLLYAVAYDSLYSREHPWLQLSEWMYRNVPAQSTVITEQWDDLLPVPARVDGQLRVPTEYRNESLPLYNPDGPAKTQMLADALAKSDYVLLASQRLYATIPRLAARYPVSARYYRLLFGGQLGFQLVAFARNDPALGSLHIVQDTFTDPGLTVPPPLSPPPSELAWNWGRADESFTVYDHPMPLLFVKTRALSVDELLALLGTQR